jgi:uncharacterized protein (DUF1778 family)
MLLRFRSKAEYAKIRKAATFEGISVNTFMVARAAKAADDILLAMARGSGKAARETDSYFGAPSS